MGWNIHNGEDSPQGAYVLRVKYELTGYFVNGTIISDTDLIYLIR